MLHLSEELVGTHLQGPQSTLTALDRCRLDMKLFEELLAQSGKGRFWIALSLAFLKGLEEMTNLGEKIAAWPSSVRLSCHQTEYT